MIIPKIEILNLPGTITFAPEIPLSVSWQEKAVFHPQLEELIILGVTVTSLSHRRQWRISWHTLPASRRWQLLPIHRTILPHYCDFSTAQFWQSQSVSTEMVLAWGWTRGTRERGRGTWKPSTVYKCKGARHHGTRTLTCWSHRNPMPSVVLKWPNGYFVSSLWKNYANYSYWLL